MSKLMSNSGKKINLAENGTRISKLSAISRKLTKKDILNATEDYLACNGKVATFGKSRNYDVIINKRRYPPKAIFGLALSKLLDAKIESMHFNAGLKSVCFKTFKRLEFTITSKKTNKNGRFHLENLEIGKEYSQSQVLITADSVPTENCVKVINKFQNCVVLFITLNEGKKYISMFNCRGKFLEWMVPQSDNLISANLDSAFDKKPIVLFAKISQKIKNKKQAFTYIGKVNYQKHEYFNDMATPLVNIFFETLEYDNNATGTLQEIYTWTPPKSNEDLDNLDITKIALSETDPPQKNEGNCITPNRRKSSISGNIDWAKRDEDNRKLGLIGEKIVLQKEIAYLNGIKRNDLAEKVVHTALSSTNAGYDIQSFDKNGSEKFIEVKTTRQSKGSSFFISRNEVDVSKKLKNKYWIHRVYSLNPKENSAKVYKMNGSVESNFDLRPENYKASIK